ncbi:MAG: Gfo/Idh/MocA family oxidoreductase [Prevotella sp.]|jgi:UDP-N-acetylglucosamine 3-dehydrogenase|nr:Gfo/Idh/MocA family oxidoreductase [Prevotella sp.]
MTKELKIGIIGLGFIGDVHVKVLAENPCANLIAVCDINEGLAQKYAQVYGCKCYTDYDEMLRDADIEAVDICVPEDYHVAPAVAAANAKKHILLEKPIAKTVVEALEIKNACEKNGVRLMINHILKFDPRYVSLFDEVKKGTMGEISQIFVKRQNPRLVAERMRGRVSFLYYLGVHDIEWMLSYMMDKKPIKVYAQRNNVINRTVNDFDTIFILVNFECGALGCVNISWNLPKNDAVGIFSTVELIGSKGMGMVDIRNQGCEIVTDSSTFFPDALHWPTYNDNVQGDMRMAIDSFIQCTLAGKPYYVDTDNAILAVKVIEAAFKSIDTGIPVEL